MIGRKKRKTISTARERVALTGEANQKNLHFTQSRLQLLEKAPKHQVVARSSHLLASLNLNHKERHHRTDNFGAHSRHLR